MQLAYTILYVEDVPASLKFYAAAFGFETKFMDDSGSFGELKTGSTSLSFCSRKLLRELGKSPQTADPDRACFEIALTTPDVPAALDRALAAGAILKQKPEQMPWGQTVAYVADGDGFLVELCTPMA